MFLLRVLPRLPKCYPAQRGTLGTFCFGFVSVVVKDKHSCEGVRTEFTCITGMLLRVLKVQRGLQHEHSYVHVLVVLLHCKMREGPRALQAYLLVILLALLHSPALNLAFLCESESLAACRSLS